MSFFYKMASLFTVHSYPRATQHLSRPLRVSSHSKTNISSRSTSCQWVPQTIFLYNFFSRPENGSWDESSGSFTDQPCDEKVPPPPDPLSSSVFLLILSFTPNSNFCSWCQFLSSLVTFSSKKYLPVRKYKLLCRVDTVKQLEGIRDMIYPIFWFQVDS